MAGTLRVRRSRGALSGFLLVLLGIWGALVPFAGPYFHFAYTPDHIWTVTAGRMWLEVLPGAGAFVGGIIVLTSRLRPTAVFGAWLAALSGAWFAVGGLLIGLWSQNITPGTPVGGRNLVIAERIGFFTGLGVVIVFVAALVLGRFTVVAARDIALAEEQAAAQAAAAQAASDRAATDRAGDDAVTGPVASPAATAGPAAAAEPGPRARPIFSRRIPAASPSGTPPDRAARTPVRARLTKVVPRQADRTAADQAAADQAAADQAAADADAEVSTP